jgi:hypothetical protein
MINVPSVYGQDWESIIAKARQNILNKISSLRRRHFKTHPV